jgi:hypothetical protein
MIHQPNGSFEGEGREIRAVCVCGRAFPVITTPQEMSLTEHIAMENGAATRKRGAASVSGRSGSNSRPD